MESIIRRLYIFVLSTSTMVIRNYILGDSSGLTSMAAMSLECGDFLEFQDALQKMRQFDDKIIYLLNTTIPTESFKAQNDPTERCKDLFEQIQSGHRKRELAITKCINLSKEKVMQLKSQRDNGTDSPQLVKALRKEQSTMRLLQSELGVEEVVKNRTMQVYHTRCRSFIHDKP